MVSAGTPAKAATRAGVKAARRRSISGHPVVVLVEKRPVDAAALDQDLRPSPAGRRRRRPGRIATCSSASFAVSVRRGSTTTTLPPRSRTARRRRRMSGAVMTLPFEIIGLPPRQRK